MSSLYINKQTNKKDSGSEFVFFRFQLITKNHLKLHLQLQLHKHFNINYTPVNKFILLSRRGETLRYRGLNGIDFMHINHNEYQIVPLTACKHNTTT